MQVCTFLLLSVHSNKIQLIVILNAPRALIAYNDNDKHHIAVLVSYMIHASPFHVFEHIVRVVTIYISYKRQP
jgi:hypothetical protein